MAANSPPTNVILNSGVDLLMGKFEKLVVLLVVLASAGALAVSLNSTKTTSETPGGLENDADGKELAQAEEPGTSPTPALGGGIEPSRGVPAQQPKTLRPLDAGGFPTNGNQPASRPKTKPKSTPVAPSAKPSKDGMPYILVNEAGLKASFMSKDYMTFSASRGDTWISLAQKFYGQSSLQRVLKLANEGVRNPGDSELLMVPLYDFAQEKRKRDNFEPAPVLNKSIAPLAKTPQASKPAPQASNPAGGIPYTVIEGDSLSLIAKKVYGKASRWREIYAANRDQLKSEHALKLGMKIYVPKSGEFKPADTKVETKVH
jgi:nucleoid-associated protein YgaU